MWYLFKKKNFLVTLLHIETSVKMPTDYELPFNKNLGMINFNTNQTFLAHI